MKITDIEAWVLRAPDDDRPHWVSHFVVPKASEILVRLRTDEGLEGFGIATSYTPIEAAVHAWSTGIDELIVGERGPTPKSVPTPLNVAAL